MRNDRERLLDIVEAIDRINKYTIRGREAFDKDELIQNWIVHHLQIIGEAATRISDDFRGANKKPFQETPRLNLGAKRVSGAVRADIQFWIPTGGTRNKNACQSFWSRAGQ